VKLLQLAKGTAPVSSVAGSAVVVPPVPATTAVEIDANRLTARGRAQQNDEAKSEKAQGLAKSDVFSSP
jgi:hypothetical protein